ncbi:similar to stage IV sporulation protein [Psychrobacillus sp. OK028]|uniref:sporulation protein YqfD n=1 Tax=Psychrobacillus sp. OK028 TaxID=1884359 RepID=UPI00088C6604|nr:sporulation protein YqfD [Psychrobacillus sp. OK028]SDM84193.1 similar to stage IV sporulation protein [Psychrobacillus sp. OK028]
MRRLIKIQAPISTDQFTLYQNLKQHNIEVFQLHTNDDHIVFSIKAKDLKAFRKVRKKLKLPIKLEDELKESTISLYSGSVLGVFYFVIIPVLFAQFIWTIQIDSDSPESNIMLTEQLKEMGIKERMIVSRLPAEQEIRQNILLKHKEYSWVHFSKSGSTFTVSPMLAPPQTEKELVVAPAVNLVAKRSGVITDFSLTKGERAVEKNIAVKKGDTLVKGFVTQGNKRIITSAEGKVYASYWIELSFELPTQVAVTNPNSSELVIQKKADNKLLFWKEIQLPAVINKYVQAGYVQKNHQVTYSLTEESIERLVRPLLFQKILKELPAGTQLLEDKVLQVSIQDDKVKGKILLLINENIAIPHVIPQGDEA